MNVLLVKYLNEQLVSEPKATADCLFYSCGFRNGEIRKAMEEFSRQELEHARMLIRCAISLCGKPVIAIPPVNQDQDEVRLLVWSIAAEESAVKKYAMIQQTIDDPQHKNMIGETIDVEQAH